METYAEHDVVWTELYDPKEGRKLRQVPWIGRCGECGALNGHHLDCSKVTMETLGALVKNSQAAEESAREKADRYWRQVVQATGKLAIIRHENNKLRRANEKLRRELHDAKVLLAIKEASDA